MPSRSTRAARRCRSPAARYVCTFTLRPAHTQATLLSSGPTGDVVDIEICTIENAFKYGTFPVCKSDQSAAPIVGGSAIVSQARTNTLSAPMRQNYASVAKSALHPGTTYACQFTFSGAVVAEKQFVAG